MEFGVIPVVDVVGRRFLQVLSACTEERAVYRMIVLLECTVRDSELNFSPRSSFYCSLAIQVVESSVIILSS